MGIEDFKEFIFYVLIFFIGFFMGVFCMCIDIDDKERMDVNRDGKITASDYVIIKNYIMNNEIKEK